LLLGFGRGLIIAATHKQTMKRFYENDNEVEPLVIRRSTLSFNLPNR